MNKNILLTVFIMVTSTIHAGDPPQKTIKIAGIQMKTTHNISENEKRILTAIEKAAVYKVDFLVSPEGSLSGYWDGFDRDSVNEALKRVVSAAEEAKIGLMLGTCIKEKTGDEEFCYNQVRVYRPEGGYMGSYSKILRCSELDYPGTGEMKQYVEGRLRTFQWNDIEFGILICNDFWATPGYTTIPNPYLPMKLKQMGAQVIFHAINSSTRQEYRPFHESSVELWAKALRIPVVEVNAAADNISERINASSGVVGPEGQRLIRVDDLGEQFFMYELLVPQREVLQGETSQ